MHPRHLTLALALAAACADSNPPTDPDAPALAKPVPNPIRIIDLGTSGGASSRAWAMNTPSDETRLVIVGHSDRVGAAFGAAYWVVNTTTLAISKGLLPEVAGATQSTALDVNASGDIVGLSQVTNSVTGPDGSRATRWTASAAGWTQSLVTTLYQSRHDASAINDAGQIAGAGPTEAGEERLYVSDGVSAIDRGGFGAQAEAAEVNVHGVVVGHFRGPVRSHAFVSVPGMPIALLPDLGYPSSATGINRDGDISGYAYTAAGESRAMIWRRSPDTGQYVAQDLGLPRARAWDINDQGEIVGSFVPGRYDKGFYWRAGVTKELPALTTRSFAYTINERGDVAGTSCCIRTSESHAVLFLNVR